jgi:hypothetical protein
VTFDDTTREYEKINEELGEVAATDDDINLR